jgi:acyl-coenzyme A synthetase/AMP-(fatty) acid ligase
VGTIADHRVTRPPGRRTHLPRRVFFVDELPHSATQKVQRYKLGDDIAERLDGSLELTDEKL